MTPMIDVVFLLLVFFVCASVGSLRDDLLPAELSGADTEAAVELPPEQPRPAFDHQQVIIRLESTPDPASVLIRLNGVPLNSTDALKRRLQQLAAADQDSTMILDVDDPVRVAHFIMVYDLCQSLQFRNISFAVREQH